MDKAQYLTRHFRKDVIEQSTGTYSMVLSLYTKKQNSIIIHVSKE